MWWTTLLLFHNNFCLLFKGGERRARSKQPKGFIGG